MMNEKLYNDSKLNLYCNNNTETHIANQIIQSEIVANNLWKKMCDTVS